MIVIPALLFYPLSSSGSNCRRVITIMFFLMQTQYNSREVLSDELRLKFQQTAQLVAHFDGKMLAPLK